MRVFFEKLFDSEGFPPRWYCGQWTEGHGWLHIISDIAIFGAYFTIPLLLIFFILRRRADLPFNAVFWCFVGFILFCGSTHLVEAIIFWEPVYRFSGVLKFLTAIISWVTVFLMLRVIPEALRFQSPHELQRMVEERTQKLRESELNLQTVNQELSQKKEEMEFIMHAFSHDLKSPLVSILGFVDLLKQDIEENSGKAANNDMKRIEQSCIGLKNLLDGFLLSMKQDALHLDRQWIQPLPIIKNIIKDLEERARKANVEILTQENFSEVYADEPCYESVIRNLLLNAIEYGCFKKIEKKTEDGSPQHMSKVWVTDEKVDDGVWVYVRDEGLGIPDEMKEKIFQKFVRLEEGSAGSGLGLHIVGKIAQKHGGKAVLDSQGGQGSKFGVFFPKKTV